MNNFIFGHACLHNLMCENPNRVDVYKDVLQNSSVHNNLIFAHHPFSQYYNQDVRVTPEYQLVCEDFGFKMPAAYHPWCKLSTDELWTLCGKLNWKAHINGLLVGSTNTIPAEMSDKGSDELQIYTRLFSDSYSYFDFLYLIGLDK